MPLAHPPDEPTFYMTVNSRRRQLEPLITDGSIPVMRNVMQFRNADSLRISEPYAGRYVLDSGGYTAMDEFGGDFPWTVAEYHDWAQDMYRVKQFDWVAVMDLACEPAFDEDMSVADRIDRTVTNTIALLDHDPEYPVLPVLQGREIDQWVACYERLRDHGIYPDYAGVGTLCRQSSGTDIAEIHRALRARTDIGHFHGFGVKATAYTHGAAFWTADSQAWAWPNQYGITLEYDGKQLHRDRSDGQPDKPHRQNFSAYYQHTRRLQQNAHAATSDSTPTTLGEYG